MKLITLAAAFVLVSLGTALAGSDHYGSENATAPDKSQTSSTGMINVRARHDVGQTVRKPMPLNEKYGQGIWGR
ncbi:hypothetical protein AU467_02450 [Mesorhizobium loti]|uniref:DUF680 domain-containing protein n=1 Tax=Rhizobium loti TaxID=381 RepID=A0A101KUI0_RHILI|nr:hypothetical protein AU467_02450 [Mesorhizobium loti]